MRAQFGAALTLLTRVPAGWLLRGGPFPAPGACVWAYPLVGALVGAATAAVLWLGRRVGLPPLVGAAWALAAATLLTGALHEDGLADTADGFGGGRDRAGKLAIMRDSRVGSYGVVAVALVLLVRWAALSVVDWRGVVAAAALSRGAVALPMLALRPARAEGLGAGLARVPAPAALGCLLLTLGFGAWAGLGAFGAALAAAAAVTVLAARQIGGFTGDVLGACAAVAEAAALTALS